MRSCGMMICVLALLGGCAHTGKPQASIRNLTHSARQTAARERTEKCERLMDEMTVSSDAATRLPVSNKVDGLGNKPISQSASLSVESLSSRTSLP
jgi:hypothetical protein